MRITTFYSYKGGLGRSLMLAWSARALEREGRSVVAIDFDLEAPGLPFKLGFSRTDDLGPGLVGLLTRFQSGQPPPESLMPWLKQVPGHERLWLLPAGPRISSEYWRGLASLSWEKLFFDADPQGARFFHWLREKLEEELGPDHVLVDSRTGVTEMGGAALSLMADQILALLGTSDEGIHGTREVLRGVLSTPRAAGRAVPRMALVLASMPAYLPSPRLQRLRRAVRDKICAEAEPLTLTLELELPLVVRSEPRLEEDEKGALGSRELRVHEDYRALLSWLEGEPIPTEAPGILIPANLTLQELRRAIALQRELAEKDPAVYLPDLALELGNLAQELRELGRMEDAVLSMRECIDIWRRLARSRSIASEPQLASALSNLATMLSSLGRREEAAEATGEAVSLYSRLAVTRPEDFEVHLAAALVNQGTQLSELGRHEEGLEAVQKAVQLWRRLAESGPSTYVYGLNSALNILSLFLLNQGRPEEAIDATEESVRIAKRLERGRPNEFVLNLVVSLGARGRAQLSDHPDVAADSFQEALRVLLPHLNPSSEHFAQIARILVRETTDACREAGIQPDVELLNEVSALVTPDADT